MLSPLGHDTRGTLKLFLSPSGRERIRQVAGTGPQKGVCETKRKKGCERGWFRRQPAPGAHRDNRGAKLEASNGVRNPSVPIAKAVTGGSAASCLKSDAVCSTVPSPPSVTQKSGISATAATALTILLLCTEQCVSKCTAWLRMPQGTHLAVNHSAHQNAILAWSSAYKSVNMVLLLLRRRGT